MVGVCERVKGGGGGLVSVENRSKSEIRAMIILQAKCNSSTGVHNEIVDGK